MPPTPISQPEWVPVDGLEPLSPSEAVRLAENLPVDPYCVLEYGYLRHGIDRAFVDGPLEDPKAVVIQHRNVQGEPVYSGKYPEAGWRLLSRLPGWFCVNGSTEDMTRLVPILQREIRLPFRWLGDMFYTLEAPPQPYSNPWVRRLGMEDIPLLQRTTPKIWSGYQTFEESLTEGIMAAAIVEGRIVSVADNSASNSRYSDIGVTTLEPYRRQGLSTAAACLVAREVQSRGRIPVWSTSSENIASQRVANKLGFRPYGRGEYLVFDGLKERGGYRPA
jgi:RimJ/RimL family protein N-acetyltransferase